MKAAALPEGYTWVDPDPVLQVDCTGPAVWQGEPGAWPEAVPAVGPDGSGFRQAGCFPKASCFQPDGLEPVAVKQAEADGTALLTWAADKRARYRFSGD